MALPVLTQNTTYYYRAYATNTAGTGYGSEVSFLTTATASAGGGGDHTPPTRYGGQPSGVLSENTTQTTISLATDEQATCKYSTERFTPDYLMPHTFSKTSGGRVSANLFPHSATVTGLKSGNTYNYYVKCFDTKGNINVDDFLISFSIPDAIPPVLSNGQPTGTLDIDTTQANISLITNEPAVCHYSTASSTNYGSMPNTFSTINGASHSALVKGLSNGNTYTYYVRCSDTSRNKNTNDFIISFDIAPSPTLFVTLNTDLSSAQTSLSKYDLTADVSGTAIGPVSYYFYCNRSDTSTNVNFNYNVEYFNIDETTKTAKYVCDYLSAGTYTAKVIVRRGQNLAESRVEVLISEKPIEKPIAETTIERIQVRVADIQQKITELFKQFAQALGEQLAKAESFLAGLWMALP